MPLDCLSLPDSGPRSRDFGSVSTSSKAVDRPVHLSGVEEIIDLGNLVLAANRSFDCLRQLIHEMSDAEKMQHLTFHVKPAPSDVLHFHEVTKSGKRWKVSFQRKWMEDYEWLSYSNVLQGGICRYCILFPEHPQRGGSKGGNPGILVTVPYQKPFTKALGKDGVLVIHEGTVVHRHAMVQADLFKLSFEKADSRVDTMLLKHKDQQSLENKEILRQIILAVEFLAKQGLPLRGHRDDKVDFATEGSNRGNFIAALQLLAKGNSTLQKHLLFAKRNQKYTSKTIQNEIVHVYANKTRERLTAHLREEQLPFAIIADEATDPHANQEVLSLCLRFVDLHSACSPVIKECLIDFIYLERANALTISEEILKSLSKPPVSLDPNNIRGQAYDGAAVMSSNIAGVQARIKETAPLAIFTHCYSHCLNLSVAATSKVQEVRNLIGTINEAYLFLSNSPKRQQMFQLTLETYLPQSSRTKLPGLCKTRWVERNTCFEVFLELYEALVTFLDAIVSPHEYPDLMSADKEWKWDRETVSKAQGLKAALSSFQTISVFITTKNVLDSVKELAGKLQERNQDILDAYAMVDESIEEIKSVRKDIDATFVSWYRDITELAANIGVAESIPRKTSLQRNRSNTPSQSPMEFYKRSLAIPLLDSLTAQMEDRFLRDGRHVGALLNLVPSIFLTSRVELGTLREGVMFWEKDLPFPKSLENELRRWETLWKRRKDRESVQEEMVRQREARIPDNLLLSLGNCDVHSFPNIHRLLLIACTLPITSAEAERSFSLMRRIKTYARSAMCEERFTDLGVLAMHYSDRIPAEEIAKAFVQEHPRRMFQASLFSET